MADARSLPGCPRPLPEQKKGRRLDFLLRAADTGRCWQCLVSIDDDVMGKDAMSNSEDRTRICEHCGEKFLINPDFDFAKLCRKCAIKRIRALEQYDDQVARIQRLTIELAQLAAQRALPFDAVEPALSPDDCGTGIRLLQPHHQAGDKAAYRIIRFLANMRKTRCTKTPDQEG